MRALLIRSPWIDLILDGKKTWEIRGSRTHIKGQIGLIASRSGTVVGVCDLVKCVGPLTATEFRKSAKKAGHRRSEAKLGYYRQTFAWVVKNARRLARPVEYRHPSGAVIWVLLEAAVDREIQGQVAPKGIDSLREEDRGTR